MSKSTVASLFGILAVVLICLICKWILHCESNLVELVLLFLLVRLTVKNEL